MNRLGRHALRKLTGTLGTLFLVSLITFLILQVIPGDPAQLVLGTEASPEALDQLRESMGLDKPVWERYAGWVEGAVRGDLGESLRYERPVRDLIVERLPVTLGLAGFAMVIAVIISIPLAVLSAAKRGGAIDVLTVGLAQVGLALPSFWTGILLILGFSVGLNWFPPGGFTSWSVSFASAIKSLTLPSIALALPMSAVLIRLTRSSMIEVLGQEYVRTARGKGLSEKRVIAKHALKNALIPTVTLAAIQLGSALGGSIVIEQVFALPGLGRLVLSAVYNRDIPLIQGCVLFVAAVVVMLNFVADLIYAALDPRVAVTEG